MDVCGNEARGSEKSTRKSNFFLLKLLFLSTEVYEDPVLFLVTPNSPKIRCLLCSISEIYK